MSHEEHHGSHGNPLGFSYFRLIIPGALLMFVMMVYSSTVYCNCNEKACCSKSEKSEKPCSHDKKCEKGDHHEEKEAHHEGGEHH